MPTVTDREAALDANIRQGDPTLNFGTIPEATIGDDATGAYRLPVAWDFTDVGIGLYGARPIIVINSSIKFTCALGAASGFSCRVERFSYLSYPFLEDACTWNEADPGTADWPDGGPSSGTGQTFNAPTTTGQKTISGSTLDTDLAASLNDDGIPAFNVRGVLENLTQHFDVWQHEHGVSADSFLLTLTYGAVPIVTTTAISAIAATTASSGGNVTDDGDGTISARGVCWNTTGTPTTSDSTTSDGTGTGAFSSSITGLDASTTYYVRAYATNEFGTAYGSEVSFTTSSGGPASRRMLLGVGK